MLDQVQKFSRSMSVVSPAHASDIASLMQAPPRSAEATAQHTERCALAFGSDGHRGKPFPFAGGVAVIPVYGALLHRDAWCDSWATGYDYIAAAFGAALGDDEVKGIVFDVNSYGGHVAGNFELCDAIFEARGRKPMMAIVDARSLSGGYSIASAVGRIIATPSADVGSIGVVMMHMSYEKMMDNFGVEVSYVYAGAHKVDGNPYVGLPDNVREALQASVDKSYNRFVSLVARNRGIEPDAVRATEARVYDADDAKSAGLIDDVMSPRAAFTLFTTELSTGSTPTQEVKKMSNNNDDGRGEKAITQADVDAAAKAASANENARMTGILSCEEAAKRPKLALKLAGKNLSVEDAREILAASPEENAAPVSRTGPLASAMDASGGAHVEAGADGGAGGDDKPEDKGARLLATSKHMRGVKPATH